MVQNPVPPPNDPKLIRQVSVAGPAIFFPGASSPLISVEKPSFAICSHALWATSTTLEIVATSLVPMLSEFVGKIVPVWALKTASVTVRDWALTLAQGMSNERESSEEASFIDLPLLTDSCRALSPVNCV